MPVIEISDKAHFDREVKKAAEKLVVVDFFATWCGPCKAIAPIYANLSEKYAKSTVFLKVDVDKNRDIAQAAKVEAMPTFGFYHKGSLLETFKGADPTKLENTIKTLSEKHAKFSFQGSGNSLVGPSTGSSNSNSGAGRGAPAPAPKGEQKARKNPWADKDFVPPGAKKDKAGESSATTATTGSAGPAGSNSNSNSGSAPAGNRPSVTNTAPASAAVQPGSGAEAQLKVNPGLVEQLLLMGFTQIRAEKALLATKNKNVEGALNWLLEHSGDPDIDEPWQVVTKPADAPNNNSNNSTPVAMNTDSNLTSQTAPVAMSTDGSTSTSTSASTSTSSGTQAAMDTTADEAELDPEMKKILAEARKRKAEEEAAKSKKSTTATTTSEPVKKSTLDMTHDEKMKWLEDKRAERKTKKAAEEVSREKDTEKSRRDIDRAARELKEKREEHLMKVANDKKKREEKEAREARKRIKEKIEADKERRKREREREAADMEKLKAEQAKRPALPPA